MANILNSLGMEHFIIGEMSDRQDLSRLIPFPSVQVLLIDFLSRQMSLKTVIVCSPYLLIELIL